LPSGKRGGKKANFSSMNLGKNIKEKKGGAHKHYFPDGPRIYSFPQKKEERSRGGLLRHP